MRVIVVDQDSMMLEAIDRGLRDQFAVDVVSTKADSLDLLRQNDFDVIVACERLADGSGLELLSQVAKRWPATLRVFAADRERLRLLQGRLGPFELFQTLVYPIEPRKLITMLSLASAAHNADADTTNIQHVVLGDDEPTDPDITPMEPPKPQRVPPPPQPPRRPPPQSQPSAPLLSPRQSSPRPGQQQSPRHAQSPRLAPSASALPRTGAPSRDAGASLPESNAVRSRSERTAAAEVAEIAAAARSRLDALDLRRPATRGAFIIGTVVAVVIVAIALGIKWFASVHETKPQEAVIVPAPPHYSRRITDLVATVESDFKQDDFARAQSDVRRLRVLAPEHPRLSFFETLLSHRADSGLRGPAKTRPAAPAPPSVSLPASGSASGRKALPGAPHDGGRGAVASATPTPAVAAPAVSAPAPSKASPPAVPAPAASKGAPPAVPVPEASSSTPQAAALAASTAATPVPAGAASGSTRVDSAVAPPTGAETPTPAPTTSASAATAATFSGHTVEGSDTPTTLPPAATTAGPTAAGPTAAASTPAATPTIRAASNNSLIAPPVIQEAQLTHRVPPEYPAGAARKGVEGAVDVRFTITAQGAVTDVFVAGSDPPDVFDRAAIDAVRRWRYDPRFVDGQAVESHLQVHLQFKLSAIKGH